MNISTDLVSLLHYVLQYSHYLHPSNGIFNVSEARSAYSISPSGRGPSAIENLLNQLN